VTLAEAYRRVRARTEALAGPLSPEDQQVQASPLSSPTKWHRAHTTWFFETFVLAPRGVPAHDASYAYLFNSYYEAVGPRHARPDRGMLSRPSSAEIARYRAAVDEPMIALLERAPDDEGLTALVELGLAHEEQHQELILTDALEALAKSPLFPSYRASAPPVHRAEPRPLTFSSFDGGLIEIGAGPESFAFDNERPRHRVFVEPFALADRLVTIGELRAFIADRGYETASLWLSDGWDFVRRNELSAPRHFYLRDGETFVYGLDGLRPALDAEPAAFLSFYEADAVARWMNARLPTEAEWEHAASTIAPRGNLLGDEILGSSLRPLPSPGGPLAQLYGDGWEWTRSSYEPYPGFAPAAGAIGEYNGKFMVSQIVLRGGSCFTPAPHVRASYRNFWAPDTRFQMTAVRLAKQREKENPR
jgi:ergothioneine biosynthesis protein EgtB